MAASRNHRSAASRRGGAAALLPTMLLLVALLAVGNAKSGGSSGGNNPSNNGNSPFRRNNNNNRGRGDSGSLPTNNGDGRPQYSLSQQLSFDPRDEKVSVSAETEALAFYERDDSSASASASAGGDEEGSRPAAAAETADEKEIEALASGIVGEVMQASVYTSDALLCSGGDQPPPDGGFVAMAECRFGMGAMDVDSDLEDEDSDDDDDDDDGHSSMLSNASLRRSLASANGASSDAPPNMDSKRYVGGRKSNGAGPSFVGGGAMPNTSRRGVRFLSLPRAGAGASSSRRPSPSLSTSLYSALSIRGGAAAAAAGAATAKDPNELARRLLVATLVTILYEIVLGHLLEFVKIVMQTSPPGTTYGDVMRSITGEKGITGVWDGFVPWGVIQSVMKGGVFGLAHAAASSYLIPLAERGVLPMHLAMTLAGAIGGLFQGYVLSPTLLLKTRVMTNDVFRESMSLLKTTLLSFKIGIDVVRDEGLLALMKGSNVFATKRLFDWATRFFFSDMFEALMLKYSETGSLTSGEKIAASLLGGTLSTFSTLPLDVLVAKTQDAKKAGVKVSAWTMFKQELDEKGWKGLGESYMKGFEARILHVSFTTVVMKTGAPIMYDYLFKKE